MDGKKAVELFMATDLLFPMINYCVEFQYAGQVIFPVHLYMSA
jgi:hypothetical protein